MRAKLTPAFCAKAAPIGKSVVYWDEQLPGFGLRVHPSGARAWVVQYRAKRIVRRMTLNFVLPLDKARREASKLLGNVASGGDPLQERRAEASRAANTLRYVAEEYLRREGKKLRRLDRRRRIFERLIYPALGSRPIMDIRRRDIVALLDDIDEQNGAVMADHTWQALRRVLNWHALRDETFRSPAVAGMRGRALWCATDREQLFDKFVRFLLLTATRRSEAAGMVRSELSNGIWTISAVRMKSNIEHVVPLSADAIAIINTIPKIGGSELIFTYDGRKPISNFSKPKAALGTLSGVTGWTLHDLRRTARSLMSRGGVAPDIAERALAHVIGGVRGIYDRHSFQAEKADAFELLAEQIRSIVGESVKLP
jgi:integrase